MPKKIRLTKLPSIVKNVPLPSEVFLSAKIEAVEGSLIAVEAGEHEGKMNVLDFLGGRLGKIWQGDIIPAVLGCRQAAVEFAGFVPPKVKVGEELYLLCESGLVGEISGVFEAWGSPMKVRVLGSILGKNNKPLFLPDFALKENSDTVSKIPLLVLLGTRMDSGKTTMGCKIIHQAVKSGYKVSAVKLTGVAFTQDLMKFSDAGGVGVFDFVDMGLPSTCNGNKKAVVGSALKMIKIAAADKPDFIIAELGDSVLGEYHVADILADPDFKKLVKMVVLAANDFAGIVGTANILDKLDYAISIVTGPIANSQSGIHLIKKYFSLKAESNQHQIPGTWQAVKELLNL